MPRAAIFQPPVGPAYALRVGPAYALTSKRYGLEAAKAMLAHTVTKFTQIYAERDVELASRIMREIG